MAKARLAYAMKGTIPELLQSPRIEIEAGRHPLLDSKEVVPLDVSVGVGSSVLITGPNTGGKTVAIKATANPPALNNMAAIAAVTCLGCRTTACLVAAEKSAAAAMKP